jgi:hypothetical protein
MGEESISLIVEAAEVVQVQEGHQGRRHNAKKGREGGRSNYKYARVTKVHTGTDGKVKAADVEYKVPWRNLILINHEAHSQACAGRASGGADVRGR